MGQGAESWLCAAAVLSGCGRIGFDSAGTLGDGGPDDGADAPIDARGTQTLELETAADTFLDATALTFAFGGSSIVESGNSSHALLRFDIAVGASAIIDGADLVLYAEMLSPNPVDVYQVLEPWVEGAETATAGVANWNERDTAIAWTSAGCGVGSRDDVVLATFIPDVSGDVVIPLDAAGVDLVRLWKISSGLNRGFTLVPRTGDFWVFDSRSGPVTRRPRLRIHFHIMNGA